MNHHRDYFSSVRSVLLWVLALNWLIAFAKIIYGFQTQCSSMTADGFHSLSDGASNVIGLMGIYFASRPKDKDHPYGHGKYETFFSLLIAALLFIAAYHIALSNIQALLSPHANPEATPLSFIIMVGTVLVNVVVVYFEKRAGEKLKSDILLADAMHTRSDILASCGVLISLWCISRGIPLVDHIVSLGIALLIAHAGVEIIKRASDVLCDASAITNTNDIRTIVLSVQGVRSCHKIRTRGRADDIHVDLHVQLDPHLQLDQAHHISYEIEAALQKAIPGVTDVLVHLEPIKKRSL